jgi:hypothetical protein
MTLFFDVLKLETESKNNDNLFLNILEDYYNVITYNRLQKIKYKSISGRSWLLNPVPLFNRKIADISYIVQYIKLAGRRNYQIFKSYSIPSLDISFYPNLIISSIKNNPLLTLSNNSIHFKFEDIFFEAQLNKGKK